MASFVGTIEEFIRYINPRAKNVVNSITRKHKQEIGRCEHCFTSSEILEAAHVTGKERPKIIEDILSQFKNGEIITVDLEVFENLFLEAHDPIDEAVLVLCRSCHRKYDETTSKVDLGVSNDVLNLREEPEKRLMSNSEITNVIRRIAPTLNVDEFANLLDSDYCHRTFSLNFAVLKKVPQPASQNEVRLAAQINGYNRWSTQMPVVRDSYLYLVNTQWTDRHRKQFETWLRGVERNA